MRTKHRDYVDVLRAFVVVQRYWESCYHPLVKAGYVCVFQVRCRHHGSHTHGACVVGIQRAFEAASYEVGPVVKAVQSVGQDSRSSEGDHPAVSFRSSRPWSCTASFVILVFHFSLLSQQSQEMFLIYVLRFSKKQRKNFIYLAVFNSFLFNSMLQCMK